MMKIGQTWYELYYKERYIFKDLWVLNKISVVSSYGFPAKKGSYIASNPDYDKMVELKTKLEKERVFK